MNLSDVREAYIPRKKRKRVGRGAGSGKGKTAGRGHKGQLSRAGGGVRPGFEGGQMPLYRRLPKRGFSNARFRRVFAIVNVGQLDGVFEDGDVVNEDSIRAKRLVNAKSGPIKILGGGELTKSLKVTASRFSESARRKIEEARGEATVA